MPTTSRIVILALLLPLWACGSGEQAPEFPPRDVREPDPAAGAELAGRVLFEGRPPARRPLHMSSDAICMEAHRDSPPLDESIVVEDGGLRDVLVHVVAGLGDWVWDYERTEAVLDQRGCRYVPHVLALRTWQPLRVRNSDPTTHNVNTTDSRRGQGFNRSMVSREKTVLWQFRQPELGLPTHCNLHPWMNAVIHVLDHPWFAVTGADGRYRLPRRLPPGRYTIEARHEKLGTRSAEVTVEADGARTLDFTFRR